MAKMAKKTGPKKAVHAENGVFLDLVDALRDRGAVEISAGPFHVKFAAPLHQAAEEEAEATPHIKPVPSADDVDIEYWSAS